MTFTFLQFFITSSFCFIIVIIFFFFVYYRRRQCYSSGNKHRTPSPGSYPVIGNLIGFLRNRHRFHDWVTQMLSQTPSLTLPAHTFLLSSHGVCTGNPTVLRHFLLCNFPNYVKGSRYSSVLHDLLGHGIFAVDGDLWFAQRKIASFEFSTKSLKRFVADTVNFELSRLLLPFLSAACDRGEVVDLQDVLSRFNFDNICNVAFGVDPESLSFSSSEEEKMMMLKNSRDASSSFVKAFDDAVEISFARFLAPVQAVWKIKRALNLGSEKRLRDAIAMIDDYAMNIISRRDVKRVNLQNPDLLSRFIASSSYIDFRDDEHKTKFLRDIVISFVLAGKDSTSTALTWFFWLMSGHPRCRRLITAELSSAAKEGRDDGSGSFDYDDLKGFHYLHAALSESLRLFPPIPIDSRLTVADDVLPDGTHVSKGWFADYSAYAMGRMDRVWGSDCREFKPERWLDGYGAFQPFEQFKFPVFHCGPRMCLGREMAYVQMKFIAASVMSWLLMGVRVQRR